ncbi:Beta-barrel assembly-enhancing protease (plasmid) [Pseudoseohaeicola sp. NH-UV-7]
MRNLLRRTACIAALITMSAVPVAAQSGAGAYLAARQAALSSDFDVAAQYYTQALVRSPNDPELLESAALAQLSLGRIDTAYPMAQQIEAAGLRSQIAHMIVVAKLSANEDYAAILERDSQKLGIGPLVDGLVEAWAQIGNGSVAQGLERFDDVAQDAGLRGFAYYQKALALAMVGDFEGADAILSGDAAGAINRTRRGAMAQAEVLSQLGRNEDALAGLTATFGSSLDPELQGLVDRLSTGERLPFTHVTSVNDGLAEVFYSVGAALSNEATPDYSLVYTRIAAYLRPDHIDALLLSAALLDELDQFDLAIETYKQVPEGHGAYHAAELGRANALNQSGKPDASVEVLEQLARAYPDLTIVHSTLGDLLRQQDDFEGAVGAYDRALALTKDGDRSQWFLFYARGISHERSDNWPEAEADFRAALELNPDQPQVLNYLGYSMVEKQINLDEALDMIQRAVAARPDSGYIVDSLGWVLYRLGRYEEAVGHMELAVELEAVDPIVNDHLGDVYWAVGRYREARFQWNRALSFDPEEKEADRIRRKLEVGLDQVLEEEGAPPLKLTKDENEG